MSTGVSYILVSMLCLSGCQSSFIQSVSNIWMYRDLVTPIPWFWVDSQYNIPNLWVTVGRRHCHKVLVTVSQSVYFCLTDDSQATRVYSLRLWLFTKESRDSCIIIILFVYMWTTSYLNDCVDFFLTGCRS